MFFEKVNLTSVNGMIGSRIIMGSAAVVVLLAGVLLFAWGDSGDDRQVTVLDNEVLPTATTLAPPTTTTTLDGPAISVAEEPPPPLDPMPFFVSPTIGDDNNDGTTADEPWRSLNASLERLGPGQTLYLMDGRYDEVSGTSIHHIIRQSGEPDSWIRIKALPGHEPVLVASEGTALEIQGNYVEVSGLRVRGEGFDEVNSFGYGLSIRRAHHVRLIGNTVSSMPLNGISAIESSNIEILNNEVFENSFWDSSQGSGISVWHSLDWDQPPAADGYHDRILGNTIYRNENKVMSKWRDFESITDGNGIIIDRNQHHNYTGRTLVANNVVFDNGGRGIMVFLSDRVDVLFNTTYHNGRTDGLEGGPVELAFTDANDVRVLNNLGWALPGAPAIREERTNGFESAGNVLVSTNQSDSSTDLDSVLTGGPVVVNPSKNETLADFRPEATGILVDAALNLQPTLSYDAVGTPREAGSADVGAYELETG